MSLLQLECEERNVAVLDESTCDEKKRVKKVCVITNGCPENRIDCARMQEFFSSNDCTVTADIKDADLIVFNACGLTQSSEQSSVNIIMFIQANKQPSAELIVCGCLPKINESRLRQVHQGFIFEHEIEQLTKIIETRTDPQHVYANHLVPRADIASTRRFRAANSC